MFGLYFGHYLVKKNRISQFQLEDLMKLQQNTRAKLGFIAVTEKLLSARQAEEINNLQKKMDQRFGDIAIEKGYLLNEEVTYLLNMQGNSYLKLVQIFTENNIFTIKEIEGYLEEYKKENNFSDSEIEALKSDDIDRIMPVFVNVDTPFYGDCISLTIRSFVRFINNEVMLKKSFKVKDYSFTTLASQQIVGSHNIFVGLAGSEEALLAIANHYAKENFTKLSEDAFDSVCEFINCSNGLYASKLSLEDIHLDMTPPKYYYDMTITSKGDIYITPVIINGEQADLIVVVGNLAGIN